jgi:hypothetical protein
MLLAVVVSVSADKIWDDGDPANHLWSSPLNWNPNTVPVANDVAQIGNLKADTPTSPVIADGMVIPASGYLSHVVVGNNTTPTGVTPTLTITGGSVASSWFNVAWNTPAAITSVVKMSGGSLNLTYGEGHFALGINSAAAGGQAYFQQTGGQINALVAIFCWDNTAAHADLLGGTFTTGRIHFWANGSINLDGGVLTVGNGPADVYYALGANIDIRSGTLIINGDATSQLVNVWIPAEFITAYDGCGRLVYDYNQRNPGKTTITAVRTASQPQPANNAPYLEENGIVLGWTAASCAVSHDVYFGTNFDDVNDAVRVRGDINGSGQVDMADLQLLLVKWLNDPSGSEPYVDINKDGDVNLEDVVELSATWLEFSDSVFRGNRTATNYSPGVLNLFQTYYWRIDEVNGPDIVKGDVWSFKPTIPSSLTRGHKLFLKRGLLTAATVFPGWGGTISYPVGENLDWDTWLDSKFNTVCTHQTWLDLLPSYRDDIYYTRWCENLDDLANGTGNFYLSGPEQPYRANLVALQAGDEDDLNNTTVRNAYKHAFDTWKVEYPDTLVYTTQNGPNNDGGIDDFQKFARPDMSFMFTYEFKTDGKLWQMWKSLRDFREYGRKGIGTTDYSEPIPYGMYFQTFRFEDDTRNIGRSEVALGQFAPIAYGYKMINAFVYACDGGANLNSELFNGLGDQTRELFFDTVAENNRQINLMGDTLVRLSSTGIYEKNEVNDDAPWYEFEPEPDKVPNWSAYAVPYISSISVQSNAGVIISKFEPLHESFDGTDYSGQTYFMVVNASIGVANDTSYYARDITLNFDFGASGITELQSINLTTGNVETIGLTHVSGSQYTMTFNLEGGRGKLFKFNTGAPFVGFYDGQ